MDLNDFRRNSGIPLVIKLAGAIVALYLTYLVLKLFAVILAMLFAVLKIVLPVAIVICVLYFVAKFLFGYDPLGKGRMPYFRK